MSSVVNKESTEKKKPTGVAGAQQLGDDSVALVRAWLDRPEALHRKPDASSERLAGVLKDPKGPAFALGFVDRVARPEDLAALLGDDPRVARSVARRPGADLVYRDSVGDDLEGSVSDRLCDRVDAACRETAAELDEPILEVDLGAPDIRGDIEGRFDFAAGQVEAHHALGNPSEADRLFDRRATLGEREELPGQALGAVQ